MIPQNLNQQNKTNEKENRMSTELKLKRIAEIELQEVEWLWYPYIPFGKITIIQGDPGEGIVAKDRLKTKSSEEFFLFVR